MEHGKRRAMQNNTNAAIIGLIGGGIGAGVILVLMLLLPLVLITLDDPEPIITPTVCLCVFIGGGVCGFIAANRSQESPLIATLIGASVILVPLLLAALIVGGEGELFGGILVAAVLLASAFGSSFITRRFKSDKKRNMKKALKRR